MKVFRIFACGAATLVALGQMAAAETRLSLSDVLPDGNFMVENAREFAEAVSDATGARW